MTAATRPCRRVQAFDALPDFDGYPDVVPAKTYSGPVVGYCFTTVGQITGYYKDGRPTAQDPPVGPGRDCGGADVTGDPGQWHDYAAPARRSRNSRGRRRRGRGSGPLPTEHLHA